MHNQIDICLAPLNLKCEDRELLCFLVYTELLPRPLSESPTIAVGETTVRIRSSKRLADSRTV